MRNQIVFGADGQPNIYALGTDSPNTGVADWWLYNVRTSHFAMIADPLDLVKIGYGLMVTGATTLNGSASLLGGATIAGNLQHTGSQLGFYGTPPTMQPTVTGCTCDGTALKSLIQALASQGLVLDHTTQ